MTGEHLGEGYLWGWWEARSGGGHKKHVLASIQSHERELLFLYHKGRLNLAVGVLKKKKKTAAEALSSSKDDKTMGKLNGKIP